MPSALALRFSPEEKKRPGNRRPKAATGRGPAGPRAASTEPSWAPRGLLERRNKPAANWSQTISNRTMTYVGDAAFGLSGAAALKSYSAAPQAVASPIRRRAATPGALLPSAARIHRTMLNHRTHSEEAAAAAASAASAELERLPSREGHGASSSWAPRHGRRARSSGEHERTSPDRNDGLHVPKHGPGSPSRFDQRRARRRPSTSPEKELERLAQYDVKSDLRPAYDVHGPPKPGQQHRPPAPTSAGERQEAGVYPEQQHGGAAHGRRARRKSAAKKQRDFLRRGSGSNLASSGSSGRSASSSAAAARTEKAAGAGGIQTRTPKAQRRREGAIASREGRADREERRGRPRALRRSGAQKAAEQVTEHRSPQQQQQVVRTRRSVANLPVMGSPKPQTQSLHRSPTKRPPHEAKMAQAAAAAAALSTAPKIGTAAGQAQRQQAASAALGSSVRNAGPPRAQQQHSAPDNAVGSPFRRVQEARPPGLLAPGPGEDVSDTVAKLCIGGLGFGGWADSPGKDPFGGLAGGWSELEGGGDLYGGGDGGFTNRQLQLRSRTSPTKSYEPPPRVRILPPPPSPSSSESSEATETTYGTGIGSSPEKESPWPVDGRIGTWRTSALQNHSAVAPSPAEYADAGNKLRLQQKSPSSFGSRKPSPRKGLVGSWGGGQYINSSSPTKGRNGGGIPFPSGW